MANILVVTGSVRPNSVNEKVVPLVTAWLEEKGAGVTIANLGELNLPFFDAPVSPSNPEFAPIDEGVLRWTAMVGDADGVVLVMPEYNSTISPVQLNALDWVYSEWHGKPVALVGYGWSGAVKAQGSVHTLFIKNLKVKLGETPTNLHFTKDLSPEGVVLDEAAVQGKLDATLDELLGMIG